MLFLNDAQSAVDHIQSDKVYVHLITMTNKVKSPKTNPRAQSKKSWAWPSSWEDFLTNTGLSNGLEMYVLLLCSQCSLTAVTLLLHSLTACLRATCSWSIACSRWGCCYCTLKKSIVWQVFGRHPYSCSICTNQQNMSILELWQLKVGTYPVSCFSFYSLETLQWLSCRLSVYQAALLYLNSH